MRTLIIGGSGFVGSHLAPFLAAKGFDLTIMSRKPVKPVNYTAKIIAADCAKPGEWQNYVKDFEVVINLAGVPVFHRWTQEYKILLRESRVATTRNLVDALPETSDKPIILINTSGAGYYGSTGDDELTEASSPGNDFLSHLARDWEAEAIKAQQKNVRVVMTRFGIILGKGGGALEQMIMPFKLFAGGPIGNGRQWVPWMHIEDLCRAELFLIKNPKISGPVNFSAPVPVRNKDLAKAIGKVLHRPSFMPAPSFMMKLLLGEFGSVILEGQRAMPKVLLDYGFMFKFRTIDEALLDLLN